MSAGIRWLTAAVIDDEQDGFASLLTLLDAFDDAFIIFERSVQCSGYELVPDGDSLFSTAADV